MGFYLNPNLSEEVISSDDLVVFLHAQRTAGSSFRRDVLGKTHGKEKIYAYQYIEGWENWHSVPEDVLENFGVFVGHSDFCKRIFSRKIHFITLLRHPVFRIFSIYDYSRKDDSSHFHDLAKNREILEFYREMMITSNARFNYFNNAMCRRVSGHYSFEAAISMIEKNFIAVGYCGKMALFSNWFSEKMGFGNIGIKSMEPDFFRYSDYLENEELVRTILKYNREDEKLFRFMNERFFKEPEDFFPWSEESGREEGSTNAPIISELKWKVVDGIEKYRILIKDKKNDQFVAKDIVEGGVYEINWTKELINNELMYRIQSQDEGVWNDLYGYKILEPTMEIVFSLLEEDERALLTKLQWEPVADSERYRVLIRNSKGLVSKRQTLQNEAYFDWGGAERSEKYIFRCQYLEAGEWKDIHKQYFEIEKPSKIFL